MRWLRLLTIAVVAAATWACASAVVPRAELGAYDGVYTLSGPGPPDRVALNGTLTIADGHYAVDTTLGTCKKRPLKVPKPWFSTVGHNMVQDPTEFACGDLSMRVVLFGGRVSSLGMGSFQSERRIALAPVCVSFPTDSAAWQRGDCARWRTDYEVVPTQHSYPIRIVRKPR